MNDGLSNNEARALYQDRNGAPPSDRAGAA
jgi:hypothetical protein